MNGNSEQGNEKVEEKSLDIMADGKKGKDMDKDIYDVITSFNKNSFNENKKVDTPITKKTYKKYYKKVLEEISELKKYVKELEDEQLYEERRKIVLAKKIDPTYKEMKPLQIATNAVLGIFSIASFIFKKAEANIALIGGLVISFVTLLAILNIPAILNLKNYPVFEVNQFKYDWALEIIDKEIENRSKILEDDNKK